MATLVTADLQSIAQIVYKTPGTVWFRRADGQHSNDGKSWATAKLSPKTTIEAAAAGDVVLLAAGVDLPLGADSHQHAGRGVRCRRGDVRDGHYVGPDLDRDRKPSLLLSRAGQCRAAR